MCFALPVVYVPSEIRKQSDKYKNTSPCPQCQITKTTRWRKGNQSAPSFQSCSAVMQFSRSQCILHFWELYTLAIHISCDTRNRQMNLCQPHTAGPRFLFPVDNGVCFIHVPMRYKMVCANKHHKQYNITIAKYCQVAVVMQLHFVV